MNDSLRSQLQITLLQNGIHSLVRGFQILDQSNPNDDFSIKEAIIFTHHGIELLLKQMLAQSNELFIFSDINKVLQQQAIANQRNISIFRLDDSPHTLSYSEAIDRVIKILQIPEFDDELQKLLKKLDRWRNMLEHYAIDEDRYDILNIINQLRSPLLQVFEKEIPGFKERSESLVETWKKVNSLSIRQIIILELKKNPRHTNNRIAQDIGRVGSDKTVAVVRHELEALGEIPAYDMREGIDGTNYPRRQRPRRK